MLFRSAQNEFELKVKKIRSDNGSEFKNLQVEEFLEEEGIKHEFSAQKHSGVLNSPSIVLAISMSVLFFLSTTLFCCGVGSGELMLDAFLLKKFFNL